MNCPDLSATMGTQVPRHRRKPPRRIAHQRPSSTAPLEVPVWSPEPAAPSVPDPAAAHSPVTEKAEPDDDAIRRMIEAAYT